MGQGFVGSVLGFVRHRVLRRFVVIDAVPGLERHGSNARHIGIFLSLREGIQSRFDITALDLEWCAQCL